MAVYWGCVRGSLEGRRVAASQMCCSLANREQHSGVVERHRARDTPRKGEMGEKDRQLERQTDTGREKHTERREKWGRKTDTQIGRQTQGERDVHSGGRNGGDAFRERLCRWLVVKRPSNTQVCLRDGSPQTIVRAATLI